ncbi:hypothetical protein BD769DRAFT_1392797 [Suillus cothurnatus]|nr:hypothetical protein BD769DRAFT_1392797 [Suillus cothurnatus]
MPGKFIGKPITFGDHFTVYGEAVMSARAMDEPTMKRLWEFAWSMDQKEYGPISCKQKAENPSEWAGFLLHTMLYLLYLLFMLCLLHYDEALQITWADVTFQVQDLLIKNHWLDAIPKLFTSQVSYQPMQFRVRLELPFQKRHQYGGIAPFYIYTDPDRPWMCLLQAFAIWWLLDHEKHEDLNGFIFCKKNWCRQHQREPDGLHVLIHNHMVSTHFIGQVSVSAHGARVVILEDL